MDYRTQTDDFLLGAFKAFAERTIENIVSSYNPVKNIVDITRKAIQDYSDLKNGVKTGQELKQEMILSVLDSLFGDMCYIYNNFTQFLPSVKISDEQARALGSHMFGATEETVNIGVAVYGGVQVFKSINWTTVKTLLKDNRGSIEIPNPFYKNKKSFTKIQFPNNPDEFNPKGLRKIGPFETKNGKIVKWIDNNKKAVYEWNEDLKYGSHYHIIGDDGNVRMPDTKGNTHFMPGNTYEFERK